MAKPLFYETVDEIFAQAGVQHEGNEQFYEECNHILHMKMSSLSVSMRLSIERIALFDQQKQALVNDLIKLKEEGEIK